MARIRRRLALIVVGLAALYAARVALWRPFPVAGTPLPDGLTRVSGVVHVHTTFSDGGGPPEEVAAAAQQAGLGFVAITDHNNLDAKPFEGYHDGVLVMVGSEISSQDGHLLGLGLREDPVYRFSGDAPDALDDIRELGGHAFATHPLSPRADFRYTGWTLPGPWGLELMNGDSQWREAGLGRLLRTAAQYPLNPRFALLSSLPSPRATLQRWDELLKQRDVAGIVGADAHSRMPIRKQTAIRFPSYRSLFELARNHVLLRSPLRGQAAEDGRAIVEALASGHSYVGVDALAPAGGFSFQAERDGQVVSMGETVAPGPGLRLRAGGAVPAGTRVSLLRDGAVVQEKEGALELADPQPGLYRVEARVPGWDIPWVITNPIAVLDEATQEARARRAAWPAPDPPPTPKRILADFETASPFAANQDDESAVEAPALDPEGGLGGGGAARLAFRLGTPTDRHPDVFCALVDGTKRDLTGFTGLAFSIRATGVYRIWFQVRDSNPRSKEQGTEWWFTSVRTSTDWQRVSVPFARLRSIDPATDGRLDLDKVVALVFVLDKGADRPGTRGTIWIDDLAAY